MAETSDCLRSVLERIRDDAQKALKLLGEAAELHSFGWKCRACGHVKIARGSAGLDSDEGLRQRLLININELMDGASADDQVIDITLHPDALPNGIRDAGEQ